MINDELRQRGYHHMVKAQKPKLTHEDVERQIEAFFADGGEIDKVEPGASGDPNLLKRGWARRSWTSKKDRE